MNPFFSELSHLSLTCFNCLEKGFSIWILEELFLAVHPWKSREISSKSLIEIPLDSSAKKIGETIPAAAPASHPARSWAFRPQNFHRTQVISPSFWNTEG